MILGAELGAWSRAENILGQQELGKHPLSPILPWCPLRIWAQTLSSLACVLPTPPPLLFLPLAAVLRVTPFSFDPKFIGVVRSAISRVLCDRLYVGRVLGCGVCAYVFGMCVSYICVCCVYVHDRVCEMCACYM